MQPGSPVPEFGARAAAKWRVPVVTDVTAHQGNQQCGPFNFPGSSSLMRGCRNPNGLWFDCSDWRACVASDSWDGLPVPPPEVIARRTDSVVRFVKAVFQGGAFASRSCRVMVVGPQMVRDVRAHERTAASDRVCRWARPA
jgi:hypothetical protein